ncbi:MAG: ABC transporter substrate-binding protein [Curvibacter sp.]|nr:ABC transporter substrate-binding protein [Curvibacter sp.]
MKKLIAVLLPLMLSGMSAQADIVIGRLGSLKNPIPAPTTAAAAGGFDLYVRKINEEGGVAGQKLSVVFRDDEFDPRKVVERSRELINEDKAVVLITPQGTPGTEALIKEGVLKDEHIAVLGPFTGASQVLAAPNIFPLRSSYEDEVAAIARQMNILFQKRVAYLYYKTSQGPLFEPVFQRIVKEAGLEYVGSAGFDIDPDPAKQAQLVAKAVEQLKGQRPDAVFAFAVGPTFPMSMLSLKEVLGPAVGRYTFSINNWEALVKKIGAADAQGVVFSQAVPYPFGVKRKIVTEYLQDLKHYSPETTPNFSGLEGYMTAKVLVTALRRAGANPSREKVLAALEGLGRLDLGDYVLNYSPVLHRVEPSVDITIIGSTGNLMK